MTYSKFIVLDIETTGVESNQDDIIEVAAVRLDQHGKIEAELDLLISTNQQISSTVTALTGLQPADLVDKPDFEAVKETIEQFIGSDPILGHNIGFDVEFLIAKGCNIKHNDTLDTLELAHTILPYQEFYSLEYLAYKFGFANQPSHRAMKDVLATVDLFKFLNQQAKSWPAAVRQEIVEQVPVDAWTWGWLVAEPLDFPNETYKTIDHRIATDQLLHSIEQASPKTKTIPVDANSPVVLIENQAEANLALALCLAANHKPSLVVLPDRFWQRINWIDVGKKLSASIEIKLPADQVYRPGAKAEFLTSQAPIGGMAARVLTTITLWEQLWDSDPARLHLGLDEKYQFEQKFSQVGQPQPASQADIVITTISGIKDLAADSSRQIILTNMGLTEDEVVLDQGRRMTPEYFAAAVASRRDFVHQFVRPHNVKAADELFKILNHFSANLAELAVVLINRYISDPPMGTFDTTIELVPDNLSEELSQAFDKVISELELYYQKLTELELDGLSRQIVSTKRLLGQFKAMRTGEGSQRVFLYASDRRFSLDLAASEPDWSALTGLTQKFRQVMVVDPGLSVTGSFEYHRRFWPEFTTLILTPETKSELTVIDDLSEQTEPVEILRQIGNRLSLGQAGKSLILASGNYDAWQTFEHLFADASASDTVVISNDTAGNIVLLADKLSTQQKVLVIGTYIWTFQLAGYLNGIDRVILGKIPFEASWRPQLRVVEEQNGGFMGFVLPRTIMKLKRILHQLSLLGWPLVLVDPRLQAKDYGRVILQSLTEFTVVPVELDAALD